MAKKERLGRLLVIGGAEDPDEEKMRILPYLVRIAGGGGARILVCSAPAADADEKARTYRALFEKIGVAEVFDAPIEDRVEAQDAGLVEAARQASAVFITGGDQLRFTAHVAGTTFFDVVRERLQKDGLIVAGTSAGAAAMGGTMIIGGTSEGTVRRSDVELAPGLGIWRDTVVDTHFNQRGRVHRLLTIFAHNPQVLGIGIDENTALDLSPGERFTVLGEGVVTVFDGRVSHTNAPQAGRDDVLAIADSVVHVLTDGYHFDLRTMRPLTPDGETIPPPHAAVD